MSKNKLWFKRRRYGYGWFPVTWQGILTIITYIIVLVAGSVLLWDVPQNTYTKEVGYYLGLTAIATAVLFWVTFKKGPKPKWRWGSKPTDNKDEDL